MKVALHPADLGEEPRRKRGPRPRPASERFWLKVDKRGPDECWLWTATLTKANGYGRFYPDNGSGVLAHRFAYEALVGPIPDGLQLDHLCRVKRCCNPAHLEPVTNRENVLRALAVTRTHCKRGHPVTKLGPCPQCSRATKRRYEQRKKDDPEFRERRRAQDRARYWREKEHGRGPVSPPP